MADDYRYADLARYNAERARGIVHTPEWRRRMERQQSDFDDEQTRRLIREGFELAGEDGPGPQFWFRMDDPRDGLPVKSDPFWPWFGLGFVLPVGVLIAIAAVIALVVSRG